jgi:predicted RNA-binding Zn ribbon-like protein
MKPLGTASDALPLLADPRLVVDFLGSQRRHGDAMAGELPDHHEATVWVREHLPPGGADEWAELVGLRATLRTLLTALVDGADVSSGALRTLNRLAARAPVSLRADPLDPDVRINRTSNASPEAVICADLARSAMVLLTEPARGRLRLCRAPGCELFFLADRPRQQWCSASCGNRARVARHHARHRTHHEP